MTAESKSMSGMTWVAIDIAKRWNTVLVESPDGRRQRFRVANSREDHDRFVGYLRRQGACRIAMEPTGTYHRPLAYRLVSEEYDVVLVSSLAAARVREAMFNSWDKNDPKDAQVILSLLKEGRTLRYHDPMEAGINDLQELSKTYVQISLAKTRLQHSLLNHYLPLYWPEFSRYWHSTRADWFVNFLHRFPTPQSACDLDLETFAREAGPLVGRKVNKRAWLEELYDLAHATIGLPVALDSMAVRMFRVQLARYQSLNRIRDQLQNLAEETLGANSDYALLKTIPGIGPALAMVILAEAGDLRRFRHHRQFLKFCGLDLAKNQSGVSRGPERLSKRGNARLRSAFWFAGTVAVRMRQGQVTRLRSHPLI